MKFIKFITLFFFASFLITSCEIEPLDSGSAVPEIGGETSTGDYWPTAINNQWVFKMDGVLQNPMKMISVNTISANTYYTFNPQTGTGLGANVSGTQRLRKLNGDYFIKLETLSSPAQGQIPGFTLTGYEMIILKDYLPVGGTWTNKYSQTTAYSDPNFPKITLDFDVLATVMEKNSSLTIAGKNYKEVIKIKYVQKVTFANETTIATSYNWYSKNVGPIKITSEIGGQTIVQELDSYIVK